MLIRIYNPSRGTWQSQRSYGPVSDVRFDHHPLPATDASGCSVWYAATSMIGALSEAFGNQGQIARTSGRRVCFVRLRTSLAVLNLAGIAARAFGLDQRIGTDQDYPLCQQWARAFYKSYPQIQGIRWRGRQAGSICLALNDRVETDRLELMADSDIAHPDVWPRIARAAIRAHLRILS
jgi:RES domain